MATEIIIAGLDTNESLYNKAVLQYVDPTLTDDNILVYPSGYVSACQYAYNNFSGHRPLVLYSYAGIRELKYRANYFYPYVQTIVPYGDFVGTPGILPTTTDLPNTRGIINVGAGDVTLGNDWFYGSATEFVELANGQYRDGNGTLVQAMTVTSVQQRSGGITRIEAGALAYFVDLFYNAGWKLKIHITGVAGFSNNPNGRFSVTNVNYTGTNVGNWVEFSHNLGTGSLTVEGQARAQWLSGAVCTAGAKLNQIRKQRDCSWWEARQCAQLVATWAPQIGYGEIDVASAVAYAGAIPSDPYTNRVAMTFSQAQSPLVDEYGTRIGINRAFNTSANDDNGLSVFKIDGRTMDEEYGSGTYLYEHPYTDLDAHTATAVNKYVDQEIPATPEIPFQNTEAPYPVPDYDSILFIKWGFYKAVETSVTHAETIQSFSSLTTYNEYTNNLLKYHWDNIATIITTTGAVTINLQHVSYLRRQGAYILIGYNDKYEQRLLCSDPEEEYAYLLFCWHAFSPARLYRDRIPVYVSQTLPDNGNYILHRSIEEALQMTTGAETRSRFVIIVTDGTYDPFVIDVNGTIVILQSEVEIIDTRTGVSSSASAVTFNLPIGAVGYLFGDATITQQSAEENRLAIKNNGAGTGYARLYKAEHENGRVIQIDAGKLIAKIDRITTAGYARAINTSGSGQFDIDANIIDSPAGLLNNEESSVALKKILRQAYVSCTSDYGIVNPATSQEGQIYRFVKTRLRNNFFSVFYFMDFPPNQAVLHLSDAVLYSEFGDYNIQNDATGTGAENMLLINGSGYAYSNKGIQSLNGLLNFIKFDIS